MILNRYKQEAESTTKSKKAKFTEGSIMKHVLVMTSTASVGILALFLVDLIDIYFLSLLGEIELAAAVGYAGTVLFFTIALSIGMMITMVALLSKSIGAGDKNLAKKQMNSVFIYTLLVILPFCFITYLAAPWILSQLGATGTTLEYAVSYLRIVIIGAPFMAIGMAANGVLRALGDAKLSMYTTLLGGIVNAVLDPLLIFGLGWGLEGAAYASLLSRLSIGFIGLYYVTRVYRFWNPDFSLSHFKKCLKPINAIAVPSMLTNLATPIGGAFTLSILSQFGPEVIAGHSVIGRVIPVAFVMLFALSGAVGPIIGQNFGAGKKQRVRQTMTDALKFTLLYVLIIAGLLWFGRQQIPLWFSLEGEAADIIVFWATFIGISFVFHGLIFMSNSAFNNLGYAKYSTITNLLKSTVFLMPFVWFGAQYGGYKGVLIGEALGVFLISLITLVWSWRVITKI